MIIKDKTTPLNSINNNSKREYNYEDEIFFHKIIDNKNTTYNYESEEKKNLTILKEKEGNSNLIISNNKTKNNLNLSDKKPRKNVINLDEFENNDINPKTNNNSLEEKSSEKIMKNKINYPKNRKDTDIDRSDNDNETNYDYKLKRDLFQELKTCLEKTDNNNIQKEENIGQTRSVKIIRNSTLVETTKMIKDDKKEKLIDIYKPYISFANSNNYFIFSFIIGIVLSIINLILSIISAVYGSIEIYSLFILINIFFIIIYSIGIFFFHKYNNSTFTIISLLQSPQNIENKKNNLYLICYLLLLFFGYYFILAIANISYKNNVKIDIKGKAYDKKKWNYSFQEKTFIQVLKSFDIINIIFNIFNWLSISLLIYIFCLFIYFFNSYQFWKRIIQIITLFFGQISFLLINISHYCFQFRNITSLDEYRLSWVAIGLIIVGIIKLIMSFFGFYVIYI